MATNSPTANCDPDAETCLTRLQSVGLAMVAEAGFISLLSLLILFGLIVRNIIRYYRYAPGKWSLIQTPADAYVLSLFVADLLQSIGACMDVRWVHRGYVKSGAFCDAQGAIQQLGETSVALATTIIAVHTFVVVWIRKGAHNRIVAWIVITAAWLFVILFVTVSVGTKNDYYAPTPYWCWIGSGYTGLRLAGEYIWLWIAMCLSILLYVPLFLWNQGYIAVDEKRWWKVGLDWRVQSEKNKDTSIRSRPNASSLALLAYPVAYSIVILPVSVARWAAFQGSSVPNGVTFFTVFLHDMFGFVNVVLLLTTKPNLLLFEDPRLAGRGRFVQGGRGGGLRGSSSPTPSRISSEANRPEGRTKPRTPTSAIRLSVLEAGSEESHLGASSNTAGRV